jgi:hypothetical protein
LDRVSRWAVRNGLEFNIKKCVCMSYSRCKEPILYEYKINSVMLGRVSEVNDLGVVFDTGLTFVDHIAGLITNSYKKNRICYKTL